MKNNPNITKLFRGFSFNRKKKPIRANLKFLEKRTVITELQKMVVEYWLRKCTESSDPSYVARLAAILEKPVIKAKVNHLGQPIEEPEKKETKDEDK